MLSANIVRKHFPADISPACLSGRTPQSGWPPFPRLRPYGPHDVAQRMTLSSALRFLGVWSGPMALAGSRPVYVCLQTIYGLNSGVFLSTLLHIPHPDRGVVWHSIQSVFTRLSTHILLTCPPPRICASVC